MSIVRFEYSRCTSLSAGPGAPYKDRIRLVLWISHEVDSHLPQQLGTLIEPFRQLETAESPHVVLASKGQGTLCPPR